MSQVVKPVLFLVTFAVGLVGACPALLADRTDEPRESSGEAAIVEENGPALSPELAALRAKVRRTIGEYYGRPMNTRDNTPWEIMHSAIAFGIDAQVAMGQPDGQQVSAIGWLCYNYPAKGMRMLTIDQGQPLPRIAYGLQGHPGQLLAMLAQSQVSKDYSIKVSGQEFTVADLIEQEKRTCRAKTELTFKLIGLSHYLKSDATWQSDLGQSWDIPRLIREEIAQPIIGGTCGGTHRMMGLSYAVQKRQTREEPLTGQWLRAEKYASDYHKYTFKLQNADGSLSSNYFRGRGDYGSADERLETTGHALEWLVYSLSDDQIREERVTRAVNYLCDLLLKNRGERWEVGSLTHGLHTLMIYDRRVFGAKPGQLREMEPQN